jgi:hypothetical protein
MNLTPAQHLKASRQHEEDAHAHELSAHLAAERGDAIGASQELAEQRFHQAVAAHHKAAAERATAPLYCVDASSGAINRVPEVEGLTDGPVHVLRFATPGDDAIAEG